MSLERHRRQEEVVNLKDIVSPGVKTAVFDMDDLLVLTRRVDDQAMRIVMNQFRVDPSDEDFLTREDFLTIDEERALIGGPVTEWFRKLLSKHRPDLSPAEEELKGLTRQFNEITAGLMEDPDTELESMPGVRELIDSLQQNGFRFVLASSAGTDKIKAVLKKTGLTDIFKDESGQDMIVSGESEGIVHGKPAPDIFLAAAKLAGVPPEDCVAFEDSKNGVLSARRARMFTVGVHNAFEVARLGVKQDLRRAHLRINSFKQLAYY